MQDIYEYYCPRCDMYFKTRDEYLDHLVIKSYKGPFVAKLRDFHGQANNAKYSLDFEDERDKETDFFLSFKFYVLKATEIWAWYQDQNDLIGRNGKRPNKSVYKYTPLIGWN